MNAARPSARWTVSRADAMLKPRRDPARRLRRKRAIVRHYCGSRRRIVMKTGRAACVALAMLSIASAGAQTRKTQQENLERFEKYAGAPIDQFEFWSLYKWQ